MLKLKIDKLSHLKKIDNSQKEELLKKKIHIRLWNNCLSDHIYLKVNLIKKFKKVEFKSSSDPKQILKPTGQIQNCLQTTYQRGSHVEKKS